MTDTAGHLGDKPPLLEVSRLTKDFRSGGVLGRRPTVRAVDDVTFTLREREALGFVGESGSGKTTVGRLIVRLVEPNAGQVRYRGRDVFGLGRGELTGYRRSVQMIFQNSLSAFNPHRRVGDLLADGLDIHRLAPGPKRRPALVELVDQVGLSPALLDRYPNQISGGQRQRIGIARALSVTPSLVIADEAVSALDVSVQAQILNLFARLRRDLGLSLLFISHDLRAVYFLCERIAVLYLGRLVEIGPRRQLVEAAAHPYTQALVSAVPNFRPGEGFTRQVMESELTEQIPDPRGCVFAPRCPLRTALGNPDECVTVRPQLKTMTTDHAAACHFTDAGTDPTINAITIGEPTIERVRSNG